MSLYEYGELLANLSIIYYKLGNFAESKFYYQKLVSSFDLDHDVVEKLIKKLPHKYMYQIG
jgi:tetratricopeptide (TPR) repeat protein